MFGLKYKSYYCFCQALIPWDRKTPLLSMHDNYTVSLLVEVLLLGGRF